MSNAAAAVLEQQAPVLAGEESPSNEVAYIVIITKAQEGGKTLVVSANANDDDVVVQLLDYDDDLQLWERRPTRKGQGYALINKKKKTCIARRDRNMGSKLILTGLDQIETNDLAVWRDDTVPGDYNAINSYVDWEQKINIPGNGSYKSGTPLVVWEWSRGAINELWTQRAQIKSISIAKIDFDLAAAAPPIDEPPVVGGVQLAHNDTDQEQTRTLSFHFVETHTYSYEYERGLEVGRSLEFSGGLPFVDGSEKKIRREGRWNFSEKSATTVRKDVSPEWPVIIPPKSRVLAAAVMLHARLRVPYVATLKVTYWNDEVLTKTSYGSFTGVNCYHVVNMLTPVHLGRGIEERPTGAELRH